MIKNGRCVFPEQSNCSAVNFRIHFTSLFEFLLILNHTHTHVLGYDIFSFFRLRGSIILLLADNSRKWPCAVVTSGGEGSITLSASGSPAWAKATTVGFSARARESALACPSKRIDLQKWDLQQKGHVHTAEYVPVEENLYRYSKTYKNGNLSSAQVPVSSSPCEPVSENQTWEHFYCVGKAKWKKDWADSAWLVSQHVFPDSQSKRKLLLSWVLIQSSSHTADIWIRLVSRFWSVSAAGLHTWALFSINCLQREERKHPSPYTVQIPWPEPVGEKGRGKSFKILVSVSKRLYTHTHNMKL